MKIFNPFHYFSIKSEFKCYTLPTNTEGTIQENNSHLLPPVTLYNSHGILKKTNPNSLIGYA